jgi:hypothetical protein
MNNRAARIFHAVNLLLSPEPVVTQSEKTDKALAMRVFARFNLHALYCGLRILSRAPVYVLHS